MPAMVPNPSPQMANLANLMMMSRPQRAASSSPGDPNFWSGGRNFDVATLNQRADIRAERLRQQQELDRQNQIQSLFMMMMQNSLPPNIDDRSKSSMRTPTRERVAGKNTRESVPSTNRPRKDLMGGFGMKPPGAIALPPGNYQSRLGQDPNY